MSAAQQARAWTPERRAELERLVAEGKTFKAIAIELGITKNQAIGAANRYGFKRASGVALTDGQKRAARALETRIANREHGELRSKQADSPGAGRCVWPHGHPGEDGFRFCGDGVAITGAPYCAEHMREAHIPAGWREVALKQIEWAAGRVGAGWKGNRAA